MIITNRLPAGRFCAARASYSAARYARFSLSSSGAAVSVGRLGFVYIPMGCN
jgi:hypothetical protein